MKSQPMIVFITAPSQEIGKQIAAALIEQRFAACVNIIGPIHSLYTWEGKICDDEEVLLIVKSRSDLIESRLIPSVQAIHPYQTPEIIAVPVVTGLPAYIDWMIQETGANPT